MSKLNVVSEITKNEEHKLNVVEPDFYFEWSPDGEQLAMQFSVHRLDDTHFMSTWLSHRYPNVSANYVRTPDGHWRCGNARLPPDLQDKMEQAYLSWVTEKALIS